MNKLVAALGVAGVIALGGCAYGPGHGGGMVYDGYYDGFYGPFVDGYWGGDGAFYYYDNGGARHRDEGGHFRRDNAAGFSHIQGHHRPE